MSSEKNIRDKKEPRRVLIYGPKDPPGGVEKVIFRYAQAIIRKHPEVSFDLIVYGENFSMERSYAAIGCRIFYLPSRPGHYLKYRRALRRIFKANTYAAVWGNYSGLTNIDLLKMAKAYHVPVRIAHSHSTQLYWENQWMGYLVPAMHLFNKKLLPLYATDYWSCSEECGNFMFNSFQIIANALNPKEFRFTEEKREVIRKEFHLTPQQLVVGHIARMCPVKNQFFLLRVFAKVLEEKPDACLLFVGDGELREPLWKAAKIMGIADQIIFAGERENIADFLCAMDVFVLCSHAEGLSVSAVEAQASGLPCLISNAVTHKTDISGLVAFMPLSAGEKAWADQISKMTGIYNSADSDVSEQKIRKNSRENSTGCNVQEQSGRDRIRAVQQQTAWKKIREHGYDISEAAEKVYRKLFR